MTIYFWCAKKWHSLERVIAARLWRLSSNEDLKYLDGPASTHPLDQDNIN